MVFVLKFVEDRVLVRVVTELDFDVLVFFIDDRIVRLLLILDGTLIDVG